jgi:hypothetical protein
MWVQEAVQAVAVVAAFVGAHAVVFGVKAKWQPVAVAA